jgi:hypothetical protein
MVVGLCDSFLSFPFTVAFVSSYHGHFSFCGCLIYTWACFLPLGFIVPWAILVLGAFLAAFYIPKFRLHVSAYYCIRFYFYL